MTTNHLVGFHVWLKVNFLTPLLYGGLELRALVQLLLALVKDDQSCDECASVPIGMFIGLKGEAPNCDDGVARWIKTIVMLVWGLRKSEIVRR